MKKSQIAAVAIFSLIMLSVGVLLGRNVFDSNTVPRSGASQFQLITEAWDITRQEYVDRNATDARALAYAAIDGMVTSLGDTGHSRFLTPDEVRQLQDFEKGQLEGVGIEVQEREGNVVVVAPIDGSPAQKAGIRPGDVILQVDGKAVQSLEDAVQRILGPAGTSVTLTIVSSGQTRNITLIRAHINIKSVTWSQLPGTSVAHIRIATLASGTTKELSDTLSVIQQQDTTGIILDLRDDPGGVLDEAVGVASEFLDAGNVLLEKSADGNVKPVPVKPTGVVVTKTPIVVLVNGGTASAAEIVASALQDAGRATLVGEKTFGTGTVLGQFSLSDGSAVLLAIQEWLTPKGRTIWHQGLAPDLVVTLPQNVGPLSPEAEAGMTKDQLEQSGDQQLLRALGLLNAQP